MTYEIHLTGGKTLELALTDASLGEAYSKWLDGSAKERRYSWEHRDRTMIINFEHVAALVVHGGEARQSAPSH